MLKRMWWEGNSHPLLVGMQTCAATVEISVAVSQENGSQPPSWPRKSTLGNIPKRCPIILQKYLFNYIHSCTICNSQKMETTLVLLNRRMVKKGVEHIHIRVLLSGKKQWHLELFMQMDGNRKRFTEWGKPDPKREIWYVFTDMWILTIIKGLWAYYSWS